MKKIAIRHHLGMGDNIVHNGMTRKIAEEYPDAEILVFAKHHNYNSTKFMFRDNPRIIVNSIEGDQEMYEIINSTKLEKLISPHFVDGPMDYIAHGDDAFYMKVNMDPSIKRDYFYVERDLDRENEVFEELITNKEIKDYVFIHEKVDQNILIDKNRLESNIPIISADTKYGIFELLKVIEMAKSVNVISSCFLSLFMCKKYNENTVAHMYCDRHELANYIKNQGLEVLL